MKSIPDQAEKTADVVWYSLLNAVTRGVPSSPRGKQTVELLSCTSIVAMNHAVVLNPIRKLNYGFMAGEAAWILSGSNRLSDIGHTVKAIKNFSDDGLTFFGAYGPKVVDQIGYVAQTLNKDNSTRQAVMNIWREQPRETKDVPCTLSFQFMIRDGKLHMFATMRSSDIFLGWPYDVFNFSMVARYLLYYLRHLNTFYDTLSLGDLHLTAASQHLYEENFAAVHTILRDDIPPDFYYLEPKKEPTSRLSPNELVQVLHNVSHQTKETSTKMLVDFLYKESAPWLV